MRNLQLIVVFLFASSANIFGQAAVSSSANAQDRVSPSQVLPPNPPQPSPLASPTPNVPSLEQLDQLFKQTSLGKTADEARLHLQWRELSNRTINDPDLVSLRRQAEAASTDLEKRERLRAYYTKFFDRMRAKADSAELKTYLDARKAEHLGGLAQNRVRPSPAPSASATPARRAKVTPPPEPPLPR